MSPGLDERSSLKILMISHHRRFKAAARSHVIARHLVARGHSVTLLLTADERRFKLTESSWDGVRVIEAPDLFWGRLRSGWDLWNLIRRKLFLDGEPGAYHLVHCFDTRPATIYPALAYTRRHDLPLLTDWNDWWGRGGLIVESRPAWYRWLFGGLETYFEEAFRKRADGLSVISTALSERAAGLGVPPEMICVLPGGALPQEFLDRPVEACRRHAGLEFEGPVLGFSSLDSYLDMDLVMRSIALLRGRDPTIRLLVTGMPSAKLLQAAREHGVEANVHLTGFLPIEELPWYLGCADLFLLPFPNKVYNVGRWPNKIGEYMSLGRPTVSNPVGDIRSLFETHQVGLLADWDPESFAGKIQELLDDHTLATQLGVNARKAALEVFDWRLLVKKLEDYYFEVLARKDARRA